VLCTDRPTADATLIQVRPERRGQRLKEVQSPTELTYIRHPLGIFSIEQNECPVVQKLIPLCCRPPYTKATQTPRFSFSGERLTSNKNKIKFGAYTIHAHSLMCYVFLPS